MNDDRLLQYTLQIFILSPRQVRVACGRYFATVADWGANRVEDRARYLGKPKIN